ncbi:unnamed protein product [Protopolystoma xenopodis]|uniref:Uncharacterized protein n=1 Tax=Protopolystoma xenopodis TaxID=117903 RepID=A0A448X4Q3_9PLAT|nr:unnamed protein product [Protopolystoma xenopodis]
MNIYICVTVSNQQYIFSLITAEEQRVTAASAESEAALRRQFAKSETQRAEYETELAELTKQRDNLLSQLSDKDLKLKELQQKDIE